ncbi:uncharacterized protein LOC111018665 [Momordica charantia]|uniref:Uncharacterized protein LOC111018665 n=1 Tax=Momordica charantia TaxID=3673 RepID=A0A6J1D8S6_MOMCH|nr:uncharacterized protein LOC111018665 [Momordica charantia]
MVLLRSTWRPRGSHHISHFDVAVYFKPSVPQRSSQRSLPPLLLHIKALSSEEEIVQMGKKLDALLGRSFKTTRCRALVNLAISRLAVLANQRQVRSSQAHSDVIQLLKLGHQERALFRVEQVIKEQKLLDAYAIIESYCEVVAERIKLLEKERECPEELKEPISGLIFASSRCGDFPELLEIRSVITSRFGKEFTARAIELRNNCAVSPMIVQKLSVRPPSLEIKLKLLKQIASENGITLKNLEDYGVPTEVQKKVEVEEKQEQPQQETKEEGVLQSLPEEIEKDDRYADSMRGRKKYKDVADAAQAAFESAAYAAVAARAAVELAQSKSLDRDDPSSLSPRPRRSSETQESKNTEIELESENKETLGGSTSIEVEESENAIELKQPVSSSSSESGDASSKENEIPIEAINVIELLEKDLVFDESDVDTGNGESISPTFEEINSSIQCREKMESESAEITTHIEESDNKNTTQNLSIGGNEAVLRTIEVRGH